MHPSEMTDADLWLAIVEKLGYCIHFGGTEIYYRGKQEAKENIWRCRDCEGIIVKQSELPNYPGDIAAAFNLPLETNDEKRKFALELAKIVIPDINIGTAGIVYEAAFATARQRSEAWYSAKRGPRSL